MSLFLKSKINFQKFMGDAASGARFCAAAWKRAGSPIRREVVRCEKFAILCAGFWQRCKVLLHLLAAFSCRPVFHPARRRR